MKFEKIYHGNPSGIDNTVIAYNQPIFYKKGHPFELLRVGTPLTFVIADSGIKSSTFEMVEKVRINRSEAQSTFEAHFDEIEQIATLVRNIIEGLAIGDMGNLLTQNHFLLQKNRRIMSRAGPAGGNRVAAWSTGRKIMRCGRRWQYDRAGR